MGVVLQFAGSSSLTDQARPITAAPVHTETRPLTEVGWCADFCETRAMTVGRSEDVERFAERYAVSGSAALVAAEIEALGSDYQGNGYTTIEQAIVLGDLLQLSEGQVLLDVGAGCGWPGLFLAERHGCAVVALDPVPGGVATAHDRAHRDGIAHRAWAIQGSAEELPIGTGSVDAVVHTDLMC